MTFTTRPTLQGTFGMVSTTHWLASQSAHRMLELGGNAFDAAAAAGFVLHVVEPHLNGAGGDLPAIISTAVDPAPRVLCGQGPAPAAATREAFAAMGLDHVPGSGPVAAAVPGAVDAWLLLLRDHGSLPLATVLEPATGYARDGHPLLAAVSATISRVRSLFEDDWTTSAELWLRGGAVPQAGSLFSNPAYATTLQRLTDIGTAAGPDVSAQAEAARQAWGQGFVAEAVDAFRPREWRHSGGAVAARPGRRGRPGGVLRDVGAACRARLARDAGREDRALGPGPVPPAGAGHAGPAGRRCPGPRHRGRHPCGRGELEARDGRPGGLVR